MMYRCCMYIVCAVLRHYELIFLTAVTLVLLSCTSDIVEKTKVSYVCQKGSDCKHLSVGGFDGNTFNSYTFSVRHGDSVLINDDDLQNIMMYKLNCKKCKSAKRKKVNDEYTVNMYFAKIKKEKSGQPLNNIELNAVLRQYKGNQVNGFCNHAVSIVNPIKTVLEKNKAFVLAQVNLF